VSAQTPSLPGTLDQVGQSLVEVAARTSAGREHVSLLARLDYADAVAYPADERWCLPPGDPLGDTAWYRGLPGRERAAVGLARVVAFLRAGIEFEAVLIQGLQALAAEPAVPEGVRAFLLLEVEEEQRHSAMFEEFISWTSASAPHLVPAVPAEVPGWLAAVVPLATAFPPAFFLAALSGEEPIDHVQRRTLRRPASETHPALRRLTARHVADEARHVSFARRLLTETVPHLDRRRRRQLQIVAPRLVRRSSAFMLGVSTEWLVGQGVAAAEARHVARQTYGHPQLAESVRRVHELCRDLGILTPATEPRWSTAGPGAA
jgi:hypothetical protein